MVRPSDKDWEEPKALVICAATTHMSLTRHFNYLHLVSGDQGAALFRQFYCDCQSLQDRYDRTEAVRWRIEPKNLEISMNG